MGKISSNLILVRLMIIFLFMILPVASIGVTFINRSISLQEEQLAGVLKHNLANELDRLTGQMEILSQSLMYLAAESDISVLTSRPEDLSPYNRYKVINDLSRRLYTLHMSTPHVYLISATIPAVSKTIRSIGYNATSIVSTSADIPAIEDMTAAQPEAFAGSLHAQSSRFEVTMGEIHYYYSLPPLPSLMGGAVPRLTFNVTYSVPSVSAALSGALPDQEARFAMIGEDGQVSLTNETDPGVLAAVRELSQDPAGWGEPGGVKTLSLSGNPCYLLWEDAPVLRTRVLFYISRNQAMGPSLHTRFWLYAISVLCAMCILLYSRYAYTHVQIPVNLLLNGFRRLEKGEMEFQITYRGKNEFSLLVHRFNKTLNRLKTLLSQLYDQKILTQQAEMKHLQAQINPHFLYNNFYILDNMLLMEDYDTAAAFCRQLGTYFKYVTRSDQLTAPLSQEIGHARAYLQIQRMRFPDSLTAEFPPPPKDMSDPAVPRIILQPILENAFKHALEQSQGEKFLSVRFRQDERFIHITVENNGPVIPPEEIERLRRSLELPAMARASTGLSNVHMRLKMTHGAGLILAARPEGGLLVELKLKRFITENDISGNRM